MSLFKKTSQQSGVNPSLQKFASELGTQLVTNQVVPSGSGKNSLAIESLNDSDLSSLNSIADNLRISIESIAGNSSIELSNAQMDAATYAGIAASDVRNFFARDLKLNVASTESIGVVPTMPISDYSPNRVALEAYDERENRNAVLFSVIYNMQNAKQDEFSETLWPTIVMSNDQVGFGVNVNLIQVYNGITRKTAGTFEDYNKRNIIRAVADASILHKDSTKLIPVNRPASLPNFVNPADVAATAILNEGISINTAPLIVKKEIDLLGISQTDEMLAKGVNNESDSIDPYVQLQYVYIKFNTDVIKVLVNNLPTANFQASVQGLERNSVLNFDTTSVLFNLDTKNADGSALVDLAAIVAQDYIVRVKLSMNGQINIETGRTVVFGNLVSVYQITDNAGNVQDMTVGIPAALKAVLDAGEIIGYDLQAYRTNANLRQRGQLIDLTKYTQLYNVPLRSPISAIHPINVDGQVDASDVQSLITATRIRINNEAVTALLNTNLLLKSYIDSRDPAGVGPDLLGVGRFYVKPIHFYEQVDVSAIVQSLSSTDAAANIRASIMNKVRDYSYNMYRSSEYKAAQDALSGGISKTPVVVIATDPVIAQYLMIEGDTRTLGNSFDYRIVETLDTRVRGKIFITFGVFDENRNTVVNPLNFGNMVWAPEVVVSANITRDGSISKELIVQPRYLFVNNLPVLTELDIEGISASTDKVAINFHAV